MEKTPDFSAIARRLVFPCLMYYDSTLNLDASRWLEERDWDTTAGKLKIFTESSSRSAILPLLVMLVEHGVEQKVSWQIIPVTPIFEGVENAINDFSLAPVAQSNLFLFEQNLAQERFEHFLFDIAEIAEVRRR